MKTQKQKFGYRKSGRYLSLALILFVGIFAGAGCASTHKTTKTETTVTYSDDAGNERVLNRGVVYGNAAEPSETTTTTTETETETQAESHGILSSTLHAVGYVISLPFIIIGSLLKAIF